MQAWGGGGLLFWLVGWVCEPQSVVLGFHHGEKPGKTHTCWCFCMFLSLFLGFSFTRNGRFSEAVVVSLRLGDESLEDVALPSGARALDLSFFCEAVTRPFCCFFEDQLISWKQPINCLLVSVSVGWFGRK